MIRAAGHAPSMLARVDGATNQQARSGDGYRSGVGALDDLDFIGTGAGRRTVSALDSTTGLPLLPGLPGRARRSLAPVVAAPVGVRVSQSRVFVGRRMSCLPALTAGATA